MWWSPASWGGMNALVMGSSELMPCLALCIAFAFLIKLPVSQLMSFLTFLILSHIPSEGRVSKDCVGLRCQLGLNHDTLLENQNGV